MSEILYKLLRSERKTLALTIDSDAQLVVRAPMRLSEKVILAFIHQKAQWIAEKQKQALDNKEKQSVFGLEDGQTILYYGNAYTVLRKASPEIIIEDNFLIIPKEMTHDGFVDWMKRQIEKLICERVNFFADLMGVEYKSIKISNAKRRWGSCGPENTLNFAWRLVMCPESVIDYVVVHELSHIKHKDHSSRFWAQVASFFPSYKEAQRWLKSNQSILIYELI